MAIITIIHAKITEQEYVKIKGKRGKRGRGKEK